jgi:hypothetical protein
VQETVPGAAGCPVLSFGGSYGATLTIYMRLHYIRNSSLGLAASSEIVYYGNSAWAARGVDAFMWIDIVNHDYAEAQPGCLDTLSYTVQLLTELGQTVSGRTQLAQVFNQCEVPPRGQPLVDYFTDAIETFPQLDYPYVLGSIPAWPVNATCAVFGEARSTDSDRLKAAATVSALSNILNVAVCNGSTNFQCHDQEYFIKPNATWWQLSSYQVLVTCKMVSKRGYLWWCLLALLLSIIRQLKNQVVSVRMTLTTVKTTRPMLALNRNWKIAIRCNDIKILTKQGNLWRLSPDLW